jgi:hypothetical protein
MPHPYLPKKKTGGRFADPPAIRVWDERAKTHLESLSDALDVTSTDHRIHSIPDPWARAILFDRALFDETHLLHSTIKGEWRGILALLGLRERRGFNGLSAREVVLDGESATAGSFTAVLAHLKPRNADLIDVRTLWDHFYTLRWHRPPFDQRRPQAFAATLPGTLLCTGADYKNVFSTDEVPWFIDGILVDPVEHIATRERQVLAEWVRLIASSIISLGHRSSRSNWIVGHLGDFAKDLERGIASAAASPAKKDATAIAKELLGESSLGLMYGLYRLLDKACMPESGVISDVEILTTKENAPRSLLVDPTLAQQWNETPREITVYRDISLATSVRLTSSGKKSEALGDNIQWCTPDFFFSDRLIYEPNVSAPSFPGCLPVKTSGSAQRRGVVLPLNSDVLRLLTPAEIAERLNIEWQPNGGAICSLKLTLKNSSGRERGCKIQKTYTEADMVSLTNLPLVATWPDFQVEDLNWKAYYTFQLWSGEKEELSVKPWADTAREPAEHRKYMLDKRRFQFYLSESYPEALICETPYYNAAMQRERRAQGILLINVPRLEQPALASGVVLGIDFGSTGSNVYIRNRESDPQPVLFSSSRVRRITEYDNGQFLGFCRYLFVPSQDWTAESILSIFHDFGDPPEGPSSRKPLRDGHVLYADDPRTLIPKDADRKRVRSNLKWGDERDRIAARDFLIQLCMQSAAEVAVQGAREVDVRFSYPTAFSRRDLNVFEAHWRTAADKTTKITGIDFKLNPRDIDNREAIAATRFFADFAGHNDHMDITGGALTIDIGGGTTDLALWKERQLLAHSSVIFAGRDILLAPIRKKPQILSEIYQLIPLDNLQKSNHDSAFNAELDAIIAKFGNEMIQALPVAEARQNVKGLLSILEVGLCGLAFYSGLLVRRLSEAERFTQGYRFPIFVGGNGSKLFTWCAIGGNLAKSEIHDRATGAFLAGANLKNLKVEIHLSARPKSEVAHGLVCGSLPLNEDAEDYARPMAGESFKTPTGLGDWKESPPSEDIMNKKVFADRRLPIFSSFLRSIDVPVTEEMLDRIGGQIDLRFGQQAQEIEAARAKDPRTKPADVVRNEPVFIMALKRYLELEINEWERRF